LTEEEIKRLVEEASQHAKDDHDRREVRQLKNRMEGLIYSNERVFDEFRDMLPEQESKKIHETLLNARLAMANEKRAEMEAAIYDLSTVSRTLSDVMLSRAAEGGRPAK
jgi:molecular chaperone DnaK